MATTIICFAGLPKTSAKSAESDFYFPQLITIFFTGNELGEMMPCGCSGGQLGGLDRRYAVLNKTLPENRLVIDTGSLVQESTEQDLIKFNIITQAFGQLGYDVVNLTELDMQIANQAGFLDGLGQLFNCITANNQADAGFPPKFTKQFEINDLKIDIIVATVDKDAQISEVAQQIAEESQTIKYNILIVSRRQMAAIAAEYDFVDCIIVHESSDDEPALISDVNTRPLIVSAGRLGKYVGRIQLALSVNTQKPLVSFDVMPVTEEIQPHQPLVELYKDYQRMLKEANLLEKHPRFILPDNLEYVGSKSCKLCHDYEYGKWMTSQRVFIPGALHQASADSRHANAFQTLEKVNSDYDPECVICHVIGMQYQTGFVSPEKTTDMKDVGCENCHGPGSEHVRSLGAAETSGPMSACTDCHTIEQSAHYAGNEEQYMEKIVHWRQPLSSVRVKEK